MTSGKFLTYPITSITIDRENRQRTELVKIDELAESIHRLGLIQPIVITPEGVLVAGERRLTACLQLGWTAIPVQFTEDLTDYELASIELEENIKRASLTWQDECLAVQKFHALKKAHEPEWQQEKTADALGISQPEVGRQLAVAKELLAGNAAVAAAPAFSTARNIVQRTKERQRDSVIAEVRAVVSHDNPAPVPPPLINEDFHKWQDSYSGPKFNLIHCDFPYGINVADSPRMNAGIADHYEDGPDIYWQLLTRLKLAMDNLVADSAHLIFWFSMDYYTETLIRLTGMGWDVNPFPLIWWKSDNKGIAPDPQRGPRRMYETAFFATRGDRKLTERGTASNLIPFPGSRTDAIHLSEKPVEMLKKIFSMVCDEYSNVLDPTCGSGNALKAASSFGAATLLGIEQLPNFYENAVNNWLAEAEDDV